MDICGVLPSVFDAKHSVQRIPVFVEQLPDPSGRQRAGDEVRVSLQQVCRRLLGLPV